KGAIYEGGIRVPGIIRWPGHVRPGTESDVPVCGVDVLPTLCEIADVPVPDDRAIDGTSITPVFDDKSIERRTPLYWQFNRAHSEVKVAMRQGDWKIVARLTEPGPQRGADLTKEEMQIVKTAGLTGFELYNLKKDIGETNDLAAAGPEPERLAKMKAELETMFRDVQADAPVWPAWEWPRHESSQIEWEQHRRFSPSK
ncbi:MAG: sulfatase/phosphatase domain-containing protein, partial [Planctomycetaceae bacterium]